MRKRSKWFVCLFVVFAALVTFAAPFANYSTHFTSVDGFSDGASPNGIDGWVARAAPQCTTDATGNPGGGSTYGALSINANGPAMVHAGSGGAMSVGDVITLSATVFYTAASTQNADLHLGLSENGTDAAANRAGIMLRRTSAGKMTLIPQSIGGTEDGANIANFMDAPAFGQANAVTFTCTITKSVTEDEFDVEYELGATSGSFTAVNATLYDAAAVYGMMDYNGPTGGEAQVDSYSHSVSGSSDKLVITSSPANVTAGVASTDFTVQRQTASGTPLNSGALTVNLSSAAGAVFRSSADDSDISSVIIADGNSTVTYKFKHTVAGAHGVTNGAASFDDGTTSITVDAAAAEQLVMDVQPSASAASGEAFVQQPIVAVADAYGNTVPGATDSIGVTSSGGTLSGITPVSAISGKASFTDLAITGEGDFTLQFSATGLGTINSTSISVGGMATHHSTDFKASETPAYSDGGLNGQNTWIAHPSYVISDAAGSGVMNRVNANGPIHTGSSLDVTSALAAGKTITLTLKLNFVGSFANQNNGAWLLGLTDNVTGFPEGAAALGAATFNNDGDNDFYVSDTTFNNGKKHDTGILWDAAYHTLTTTIAKSATPNEFDVTADLDGQMTSFTVTHAGLYGGATAYAGFRYRGNQDGNVDSFSVQSSSAGATSSGVDVGAFETAEGVMVEFAAYDVEADGSIILVLLDDDENVVWQGTVDVTAGPEFFARFLVPGLEQGGSYHFKVRDEVGKWWDAPGVTVQPFAAEMLSATLAGIEISFDSIAGHAYDVEWAAALGQSWSVIDTVTATGPKTTVVAAHPEGSELSGFFRVRMK